MHRCISSADTWEVPVKYLLKTNPYSRPFSDVRLKDDGVRGEGQTRAKATKAVLRGYCPAQTTTEDQSEVHLQLSQLQAEVSEALALGTNFGELPGSSVIKIKNT